MSEFSFKNCKTIKMSIDKVTKVEAPTFGYLLADFLEVEYLTLWTDVLTIEKLKALKKQFKLSPMLMAKFKQLKISHDENDNVKIFRQLKYNIANSKNLQDIHFVGIFIKADGWKCMGQGLKKSSCVKKFMI